MAKKGKKDYFGLNKVVSLILCIIPVTSWLLGAIQRISDGAIVAGILRLLGAGLIIWVVDLYMMITKGHIWRLLNV